MAEQAALEVLHPGALTTIQDLGRPGFAHLGIPRSGAADRRSLRLANQLVGNSPAAACLETTVVGPRLEILGAVRIAITGAPVEATLDGEAVPMNTAVDASVGAVLKLGTARSGLHNYVSFAGGIELEPVLGSRCSDLRNRIGPAPLASGDRIQLSTSAGATPHVDQRLEPAVLEDQIRLRVSLGPRADWFSEAAIDRLFSEPFRVSPHSDRVGVRLEGPHPLAPGPGELLSEGLVPGAIQVPGDGQPIIMLADHPTTGGYPVIAVIDSEDVWIVGQLRPGQQLRFRR